MAETQVLETQTSETDLPDSSDDVENPVSSEEQDSSAEESQESEQERGPKSFDEIEALIASAGSERKAIAQGLITPEEGDLADRQRQSQADHRASVSAAQGEYYTASQNLAAEVWKIAESTYSRAQERGEDPDLDYAQERLKSVLDNAAMTGYNAALNSVKATAQAKLLDLMGDSAEYRALIKDKNAGLIVDAFLEQSDLANRRKYAPPTPQDKKAAAKSEQANNSAEMAPPNRTTRPAPSKVTYQQILKMKPAEINALPSEVYLAAINGG